MSSNGLKEVKNITEVYKTITPKSGYGQLQEVVNKRASVWDKIIANSSSWQVYFFVSHNQGPTNIFDKTCPWASGISKSLAQQSELVVPLNNGRGEAIHLTVAKSIQVIV